MKYNKSVEEVMQAMGFYMQIKTSKPNIFFYIHFLLILHILYYFMYIYIYIYIYMHKLLLFNFLFVWFIGFFVNFPKFLLDLTLYILIYFHTFSGVFFNF